MKDVIKYKKILIKLSGEALEEQNKTISKKVLDDILYQVSYLKEKYDLSISIVVGGGNIFRGKISSNLGLGSDTEKADYMGILATTINALGISAFFTHRNLENHVFNSLKIEKIAEETDFKKAKKLFDEKKVIIFGGGTGKPYVSTDTAAVLRAFDIEADVILMAKNGVDGIYDSDPKINKSANFISNISFEDIIEKNLKALDIEACQLLNNSDKNINVILFNMNKKNNIINLYEKDNVKFTLINKEGK